MNRKILQKKEIADFVKRLDPLILGLAALAVCLVVALGGWVLLKPSVSVPPPSGSMEKQLERIELAISELSGRIDRMEKGEDFETLWRERMDHLEGTLSVRLNAVNEQIMNVNMRIDRLSAKPHTASAASPSPEPRVSSAVQKAAPVQKVPIVQKAPAVQKKTATPAPVAQQPEEHIVSSGETVYSISRKYGVSVDALRTMNRLTAKSTIYVGQKLKIR